MPLLEQSGLYYPNRFARWFFLATTDVMGKHGLSAVLSLAGLESYTDNPPTDDMARQFDFANIAALNQALEDMYGARGGRGMALRIGRASFTQGMRQFGAFSGMNAAAYRELPLEKHIEIGLKALSVVFTRFTDQESILEEEDDAYLMRVENSPMVWGRITDKPACHMLVGLMQESLHWSSIGHEFHVQETSCRASGGDDCIFKINKKPIGLMLKR
ncbi:MAG: 4-vinyl reductase [Aggregatilineales bacterium]